MELLQLKGPQITFEPNKKLEYLKNTMLITYVVLETLYKTIFGKYLDVEMERLQCVVGAVLACLLLIEWFRLDKDNKKKWIKRHAFVFVYFAIRIVTFASIGFQYTMLRSVFFEGIYLLVLTELILDSVFCKKIICNFFIFTNLVLNVINTFFYEYSNFIENRNMTELDLIYCFAKNYTYMGEFTWHNYSSMYSNPNFIGMFTGLAMIMMLNKISSKNSIRTNVLLGVYFAFSIYCIWVSNCTNAQLAVVGVLFLFWIVEKKAIDKKKIIVICLIICILITYMFYIIAANNEPNAWLTEDEFKLDYYMSQRYSIWKDSYYSHMDESLLGCGNMTLEKRDRYQFSLDRGVDLGLDVNSSLVDYVGPHNGYVGMISCTGLLGFAAYITLLLKKIRDSKTLNNRYWYLSIIFILFINMFECMVLINKNVITLFMFILITMDDREEVA